MITDRQLGHATRKVLQTVRFCAWSAVVTKITLDLMTLTITGGVKLLWFVPIYPSENAFVVQIAAFLVTCVYGASTLRFFMTLYNYLWNKTVTRACHWLEQNKTVIVKRKA